MRNNQLKTRQEKIRFLNGLKTGVAKISDIKPLSVEIMQVWYCKDGVFINQRTKEHLDVAGFNARKEMHKNVLFLVTDGPGYPLINAEFSSEKVMTISDELDKSI